VILTAPDVDTEEFDQRFKQEIRALADQLTVYVSSNDRALLMSRIVNWGRRRGESTLGPEQLEEAISVVDMMEPNGQLITLVDVTPVNRTRNFHNFSLETPEFFDDLFLRLTNTDPPRSRLLYKVKTPDEKFYWVLTRGR
jgi:esterase/lipase superfamily enzyme